MVKASRHLCIFSRQPLLIIMVFSSEDRILIEQLHRSKGYGARKLVKEFPEKGWKVKFLQNAVCQKSLKSVNI